MMMMIITLMIMVTMIMMTMMMIRMTMMTVNVESTVDATSSLLNPVSKPQPLWEEGLLS